MNYYCGCIFCIQIYYTPVTVYSERSIKMKTSEKSLFAEILSELAREGELVVSNLETEIFFSGEDIRIVCVEGNVIHICLSKSASERIAK